MALINCPECKKEMSSKAASCPHCGYAKIIPKQSNSGCGTVILVFILFAVFSSLYKSCTEHNNPPPPKTPAEQRKDHIGQAFNHWNGSHVNLTRYVKENLKDPGSFEHIETRYNDNGDSLYITMKYRAKNSFGGYVVNMATATAKIDGTLTEVNIGE